MTTPEQFARLLTAPEGTRLEFKTAKGSYSFDGLGRRRGVMNDMVQAPTPCAISPRHISGTLRNEEAHMVQPSPLPPV